MIRVLLFWSGSRGHAEGLCFRKPRTSATAIVLGLLISTTGFTETVAAEVSSIMVYGPTPSRAEAIRQHSEAVRARIFLAILGTAAPRPWQVPCEIHVHATHARFEAAVGGPPAGSGGATTIEFAGDSVARRRIDVMGDRPVPDALAHEIVHVVLADRFPHAPPPRWADEGLAILFDSPAKQAGHEADFQAARQDGMIWSAAHLFAMEDYPVEPGRQRVFYGQSAALTRWLIDRGSMATFLKFLDEASLAGTTVALERHYGFTSPEALERAWLHAPSRIDLGIDWTSP